MTNLKTTKTGANHWTVVGHDVMVVRTFRSVREGAHGNLKRQATFHAVGAGGELAKGSSLKSCLDRLSNTFKASS